MNKILDLKKDTINILIEALDNMESTKQVESAKNIILNEGFEYNDTELVAYLPFVYDETNDNESIINDVSFSISEGILDNNFLLYINNIPHYK